MVDTSLLISGTGNANLTNQDSKFYYYQDNKRVSINSPNQVHTVKVLDTYSPTSNVIINETISSPGSRPLLERRVESSKLIPTSSKIIGENSYLTGNITKHSFRNGKLVTEHIRSDELIPSNEFASVKSVRYEYADEPQLANNYVRREEDLQNLGIK